MSQLQTLVEKLQDTDAMIRQMREAIEQDTSDEILKSNRASIEKRRNDLARRLDYALNATQSELVSYRIIRDHSKTYPAKAVAAAITAFQELFTSVFDALNTQPKQRYRPSIESQQLSTFDFAGAAAGSVIVSLAVPNDRLLVGETDLDRTFSFVERALSARESEDLKLLANEIGVASITKAYIWAKEAETYGLDTEIKWGKSLRDMREVKITHSEAAFVKELIENKSDKSETTLDMTGNLVGFDGDTSYFHLKTTDGLDIKGDLSSELSRAWTTDRLYSARIFQSSFVKYATGDRVEKHTLISLAPIELIDDN